LKAWQSHHICRELQLGAFLRPILLHHGVIYGKEHSHIFQGRRNYTKGQPGGDRRLAQMVKGAVFQGIIEGIKGFIGNLGDYVYPGKTDVAEAVQRQHRNN